MDGEFTKRSAFMLWLVGAVLFMGACLATGCTSTIQNSADIGFKYSTEFAFFHRAAKTSGGDADSVAKTNTEFPALVEWVLEGPPPPEPETTTVMIDGQMKVMVPMCFENHTHLFEAPAVGEMQARGASIGFCGQTPK
jgi:hypothetical protein